MTKRSDVHWRLFWITAPPGLRDALAGLLPDLGSRGLEEKDDRIGAYFEGPEPTERIRERIQALLDRLAEAGLETAGVKVEPEDLPERDWGRSWKDSLRPVRLPCGLLIVPDGAEPAPGEGIRIDPGAAFGSGHHETTARCACLVLEHGPRARRSADRFLDAGTGTGILAVVAARAGFRGLVALDPDPEALRTARRNLERNGVADRVRLLRAALEEAPAGPYGMIAANLLSGLLERHAGFLASALAPGGLLVASGMLSGQERAVRAAFTGAGLGILSEWRDGAWTTLLLGRP